MSFKWKIILAFAAIYLIWGSTYLAILWVLPGIPPILMSGFRFLSAGLILYGWCVWKKEKQPGTNSILKNSFCGILMLGIGSGSVAWSEQYISSSLAAVIVSSVPFWFVVMDKKNWRTYFSNKLIIFGLILGFVGVLLLILNSGQADHEVKGNDRSLLAILVLVASGIAWAGGSLYAKYKPAANSVLMNAAIQLSVAGIFSLLLSVITGESGNFQFSKVSTNSWLAFIYLVLAGSIVGYLCYLWLLKVKPAAQVSTYVYINPMVAMLLGVIFAGERITLVQLLAFVIILCGVLIVNLWKYKSENPDQSSTS